jgi:hypothetical protein
MFKSKRAKLMGLGLARERRRMPTKFLLENLKERGTSM